MRCLISLSGGPCYTLQAHTCAHWSPHVNEPTAQVNGGRSLASAAGSFLCMCTVTGLTKEDQSISCQEEKGTLEQQWQIRRSTALSTALVSQMLIRLMWWASARKWSENSEVVLHSYEISQAEASCWCYWSCATHVPNQTGRLCRKEGKEGRMEWEGEREGGVAKEWCRMECERRERKDGNVRDE